MKILKYILVLLVGVSNGLWAQNPNNHWQLGNSDVNFSTNPPTVTSAGNVNQYGNASITDDNGNLLFYTNGFSVWNKNHQLIQNIYNPLYLTSYSTLLQKVVIVPQPNSSRYYIFNQTPDNYLNGQYNYFHIYNYSIVDFTNNPLGEIIDFSQNNSGWYYRTLQASGVGEPVQGQGFNGPLTVSKNSTDTGYWIITQGDATTSVEGFNAYKLDSSGLDLAPITSTWTSSLTSINNQNLTFKFSPNNSKIGILQSNNSYSESKFYTYDFNNATGVFSNKLSYTFTQPFFSAFNFEFSQDSQKVYFAKWDLIVKDITTLNSAARIITNLPTIPTPDPAQNIAIKWQLQRDKNGEILVTGNSLNTIRKIDNQNSFSTSSLSGTYLNLNSISISPNSLPQLISALPPACPSILVINTNVTTGIDKKQASTSIEAANIINSGFGAIYHAPTVLLKPNFNAKAGSTSHIYPVGCSNTFIARQSQTYSNIESEEAEIKVKKEVINISPNPNNGIFKIGINEVSEGTIVVTDLYGFTVFKSEIKNQNEFEMNLQDNPKGIYIVKVVSGDQTYTSKIIKN